MQLNWQMCAWLILPGRGRDGAPLHPGCAAEKGESTLCAAASSPASPPESPRQSPLAPPASRSAISTQEYRANIRGQACTGSDSGDRFNHLC